MTSSSTGGLHAVKIGSGEQSNHGVSGVAWIGRSDDEREGRNPDAFGTVVTGVSVTCDFLDLLGLEEGWKRHGVVTPVNVIEFVKVKGFEIRLGNTLLSIMLAKLIVDVHGVGYDHHLYVSMPTS